jgi:hypothetical protein
VDPDVDLESVNDIGVGLETVPDFKAMLGINF